MERETILISKYDDPAEDENGQPWSGAYVGASAERNLPAGGHRKGKVVAVEDAPPDGEIEMQLITIEWEE